MDRTEPGHAKARGLAFGLALGLAFSAGCVDSLGYLHLKGFFLSFMSGNSTRFAIGLAASDPHPLAVAGALLALFVSGVVLGALPARPRLALALSALLLGLGALSATLSHDRLAIGLSALALGAANNVVQHAGRTSISATYITGTLVKLGQNLATALRGDDRWAWLPYALLWASLLAGAVLGAMLFPDLGLRALWVPAALCAALVLVPVTDGRHE